MSEHTVELNRLLERVYKQSQCIDVESLCIVTGEKVSNYLIILTFFHNVAIIPAFLKMYECILKLYPKTKNFTYVKF